MDTIPKILIHMLEHESAQARSVLSAAEGIDPHYTPCSGIRPLEDLANHLAQIPIIDYKFFTKEFNSFEQVHALEKELRLSAIKDLLTVFDEGVATIVKRMKRLSDKSVLKEDLKAFFEQGPEKSWAQCIPEITTHIAMHKMELWMYLKLAGAPVSMWTYYGVSESK